MLPSIWCIACALALRWTPGAIARELVVMSCVWFWCLVHCLCNGVQMDPGAIVLSCVWFFLMVLACGAIARELIVLSCVWFWCRSNLAGNGGIVRW